MLCVLEESPNPVLRTPLLQAVPGTFWNIIVIVSMHSMSWSLSLSPCHVLRAAVWRDSRPCCEHIARKDQIQRSPLKDSAHVPWGGRHVHGQGTTVCRSGAPDSDQAPEREIEKNDTPTLLIGVNWFCYSAIGLLFLTDFTPLGTTILGSDNPGAALALLQWGAFVLPTLYFCRQQGYDLQKTFSLRLPCTSWLAGAAAAGPMLFLAVTALVRLRVGLDEGAVTAAASSSASPILSTAGQSVGALLLLYVFSPAVAEELLFRGFLLTALRERLGKWDSIAVSGALFALMHLSIEQFFQFSLLGFACGWVCLAADSLAPAVVLHATYNLSAVLLAVSSGS